MKAIQEMHQLVTTAQTVTELEEKVLDQIVQFEYDVDDYLAACEKSVNDQIAEMMIDQEFETPEVINLENGLETIKNRYNTYVAGLWGLYEKFENELPVGV